MHTKLGKKSGWTEIRTRQRRITAVARGFSNCVQIGSNGSENDAKRTFDNYSTYACVLPILKVLPNLINLFCQMGILRQDQLLGHILA